MAEKTPLEELDDAVHRFHERVRGEDNPHRLSGWFLQFQSTRLQTEDPSEFALASSENFAIGPGTTVVQAAGLARFGSVAMDETMARALKFGNGDD